MRLESYDFCQSLFCTHRDFRVTSDISKRDINMSGMSSKSQKSKQKAHINENLKVIIFCQCCINVIFCF